MQRKQQKMEHYIDNLRSRSSAGVYVLKEIKNYMEISKKIANEMSRQCSITTKYLNKIKLTGKNIKNRAILTGSAYVKKSSKSKFNSSGKTNQISDYVRSFEQADYSPE